MQPWFPSAVLLLASIACVSGAEVDTHPLEDPDFREETSVQLAEGEDLSNDAQSGLILPESDEGALQPTGSQKPYSLHFRVTTRSTYDDNIFIQETNTEADLIWSIAPGVVFGLGDMAERKGPYVAVSYDANAFLFTDHDDLNSIDHDAALRVQWTGAKLTLTGHAIFRDLTGTNNETADRINRKTYDAGLAGTYVVSDKTTLGAELSGNISDYRRQLDTEGADLRFWGDHQIGVLTKVGLGATFGFVDVSQGSAQAFQQLLSRLNYAAGEKLDLTAQVGGELRQIEDGETQATPVFSLAATYSPYPLLKMRVDGYRRVQPSIVAAGANTELTGASLNVTYRFLARFEASASASYEHTEYDGVSDDTPISRDDDYFLSRFGLGYAFGDHVRVGAFYLTRTNDSTQANRSFDNNQVGVEATVSF